MLLPGGSNEIAAMIDENDNVTTDPQAIASLLNDYWQCVFNAKATDKQLRRKWLESVKNKFKVPKSRQRPSKELVRQVIKDAACSASGPDNVPSEVYKALGEQAVEIFFEAANAMLDGDISPMKISILR